VFPEQDPTHWSPADLSDLHGMLTLLKLLETIYP
jgi:hypothetical protein